MLRNLMMIVNPYSGRGISKDALGTIVVKLCNNGYAVTVYLAGKQSPEQLACEYAKHHELVVCVGGDGTLSLVVSGLLRAAVSVPVGYIPFGTANDVAATLALSKYPLAAAQTIIDGKLRPLDIGSFYGGSAQDETGRYFTYIAAFGAFTDVAYTTPQNAKRSLGHFAYVLGGVASVPTITARHTIVELDGSVIEGDFIFGGVSNSTSVAGLVKLDPGYVDLADGLFEVILVRQPVTLADFLDILTSIRTQSYKGDNIQMLQAERVKFTFDSPVAWTVDGEDGGEHRDVLITNCREAINIIV